MPQCGVMGQAAGTAAALSLGSDVPPAQVDVAQLQEKLKAAGCIVDEDGIESAKEG